MIDVADDSLIEALKKRALYDHDVDGFEVIETHISWVLLTGQYAYKIKKPVDFGFLDFSTLADRRYYCYEELELNQRFAPDIYLDVVSIGGTVEQPEFGASSVLEYAVKMRQFRQEELLSRIAQRGELTEAHCEQIAQVLAGFHGRTKQADYSNKFGSSRHVLYWVNENFSHIEPMLRQDDDICRLQNIKQWAENASRYLSSVMESRKQQGFVRECHGDLHLGNMAYLDSKITFFDCIEFSEDLRWIDVINEAAFVAMDIAERGYQALSWRFLNRYLQETGDYASLVLYRYYYVYRALVRAKVALLKTAEVELAGGDAQAEWLEYRAYIDLASSQITKSTPQIIIMQGFSGSGKSTVARRVADVVGGIHVRSDLERKRMFNIELTASSHSELNAGIYSTQTSVNVYQQLHRFCRHIVDAGYTVIVDATFLKLAQRDQFKALADSLSLPFSILSVQAPVDLLRQRVRSRSEQANDPSEANEDVLNAQLNSHEDLAERELRYTIVIDNSNGFSDVQLNELADSLCQRSVDNRSGKADIGISAQ
ncbi:MAG: aminoglycoside phosphotransferase [Gammaproteobacteria bacterium]|nr:MAG: aminoglycoside phosphotransferase [Gammaproteobacteria bacterium]